MSLAHPDLSPAPGRYPIPLSPRWTAVALVPIPDVVVLGLFLDGELLEVLDDPADVAGYLAFLLGGALRPRDANAVGSACDRGNSSSPAPCSFTAA